MIKHTHTESMNINFSSLERRILQINDPVKGKYLNLQELVASLIINKNPTLIMATGGSKVVAYYLKLILENSDGKIICEVIEPRDYFYKTNTQSYSNLVVISASGRTTGIEEALNKFPGNKYLICKEKREAYDKVISWGNELYKGEKSFISLADSLGPISLLLDIAISKKSITPCEIQNINTRISEIIKKSEEKIARLNISFQDASLVQILSGYDTLASASVLESNLTESGLAYVVTHDKGSFCHGRSNLLFNYPNSQVIYLGHNYQKLDNTLIKLIDSEYPNLSTFTSDNIDDSILWQEYYLMFQMYFLSKKIAEDKGIDLTSPEYNPRLVRTLYNFKGEM